MNTVGSVSRFSENLHFLLQINVIKITFALKPPFVCTVKCTVNENNLPVSVLATPHGISINMKKSAKERNYSLL